MKRGFTLLEVMVALAILALGLVAIVNINGNAIRTHGYSKRVTVATLLARSKMADIESHFIQEGFTSDFDQRMQGDFSEEGWGDFRWEAEIVRADLDAANATALIETLFEGFLGGAEKQQDLGGGPVPDLSPYLQSMRPMVEAQLTQLIETMKESIREVRLRVFWKEGRSEDSVDVVTHLVILAPAGQPGGASLDPSGETETPPAGTDGGSLQPAPGGGGS